MDTLSEPTSIQLKRDTAAVQIPAGHSALLPAGTPVFLTQTLGGTFTVRTDTGLYRIASTDADALGLKPAPPSGAATPGVEPASAELDERQIWDILKSCYDPEIPVNIVDLGLVYDLSLRRLPNGRYGVAVKMTLTAPGCGMGPVIAGDAQQKILLIEAVEEAAVDIVWDPPWHQSMITAEGRKILGLE